MPLSRLIPCLLALSTLGLPSRAAGQVDARLNEKLESVRKEYKLVALAGARYQRDQPLRLGVVGKRKHRRDVAVERGDQFHLGSCTKAMTATLLALLVQDGKLRWDMNLAQGLPDLADSMHADYKKVTLAMLLAHRSGMPHTVPKGWTLLNMHALKGPIVEARREYVAKILSQPPEHASDTRFAYSNAGYTVAAAFAEQATGKSWEELIQARLFKPLGMTTAGFGAMGTKGELDQPRQHRGKGRMIQSIEPGPRSDNPRVIGPAGLVHCSMEDWSKFIALHAVSPEVHKSLLNLETWTWLHTSYKGQTYAPGGWDVKKRPWGGGAVLTHNGSNTMNCAVAWVAPKQGRAYLAATNSAGRQEFAALNMVIGELIQEPIAPKPDDPG